MIRLYLLAGFACLFLMMNMNGNLNKYINMKYAYLSRSAIALLVVLFAFEFIRLYAKEKDAGKRKAKLEAERQSAEAEGSALLAALQASEGGEDASEGHRHDAQAIGDHAAHGHHHHGQHEHGYAEASHGGYVHEDYHDHARHSREHGHHDHHDHHDHREHGHNHVHGEHDHDGHGHNHDHGHDHHHDHHGHSHEQPIRWKRYLGYGILIFPLLTGFFLPVQTLDSSFVKAKGFSFPDFNVSADNPGFHQFLKPDTSVFYGKQGYAKVSKKELNEFTGAKDLELSDANFLKGLEALYNYPDAFIGREIGFDGFIYKGQQVEGNAYFVFRFGFIHCVADSGVFGMLVRFPEGQAFQNDQWVHVTGKLSSEFYQPFKQTLPVLEVKAWNDIDKPKDPYVYRA
ncbi:TIGR03943 family protein [Paenibacillus lycopersici]|uniref:TIGR03943 family protein n=1 Tax=Paenibacillus lycopersici TaxID=2704462 RepID=A0A6C0FWQ1_9BACL|nr:TIGR03943 family protein [Paenibacillus lycopersici]QHT61538.1 TIGR03943 family protein [Paenibacillus lycopersici]